MHLLESSATAADPRVFALIDGVARSSLAREEVVVAVRDPLGECIPAYAFWTPEREGFAAPPRARLCPDDSERQAVRITLKGAGIPERAVRDPAGRVVLQVFWRGHWWPFEQLLAIARSASPSIPTASP